MYDLLNRAFFVIILFCTVYKSTSWIDTYIPEILTTNPLITESYKSTATQLTYFHYSVNRGYFKKYSWTADYYYHPSSQLTLIAWLDNNVLIDVRRQLSSKTYVTGHSAEFCDPIDLITIHSGNRIGFLCIAWETVSYLENSFNPCLLYNRNS